MKRLFANIYVKILVINMVVFVLTSPFIVLYGPFSNIKNSVIGAIMTSRHPQYISWLLSEQEIKAVLGNIDPSGQQRQKLFQFTQRQDESLKMVSI